jgi:acyl-CoA synthetase (AMP-forming)/AMP-acid ligase II
MTHWRAHDALELVARHRVPGLGGIPTQIALMLREPDFDRFDLSCVRAIVVGGAPSTPALLREARERFAAAVAVRYSCTEAGVGLGTAFDAPSEDAEVSVGRPHHGVTVEIVDDDGATVDTVDADRAGASRRAGPVGEVCLRSPGVMHGYWRDPDATRDAFTATGAVRTGDLGWIDEHGRLRLAGRRHERYIRGGYNVYPVEVEAVLAEHPGVADVAVVARSDAVMGEVGVAVVVPSDPAAPPTLGDLRAFGAGRLADYKLPAAVRVMDALPLTAMEKVDRRRLRELLGDDAGR